VKAHLTRRVHKHQSRADPQEIDDLQVVWCVLHNDFELGRDDQQSSAGQNGTDARDATLLRPCAQLLPRNLQNQPANWNDSRIRIKADHGLSLSGSFGL
jgi:hypothetical protein